ncbi:hypothetical protein MFUL124B02_02675 [Myxococcus fulvus 124B02]|nr:hypothetical protein MFUL124B02_02675 [Myxococcus fulvus 124B02]
MSTTSWLVTAAIICGPVFLSGCSLLGHYKPKQAERAPAAESAKVTFPDSFEQGTHLDGPAMVALEVAMNTFLPPDRRPEARDEALSRCLARRDTYDTTVLKENDDLYFVSFLPRLSRCGIELETPIMDAGAVYAIDARGRILAEL